MTSRILKAFTPVIAIVTIGSTSVFASTAEEPAEDRTQTRMVSSPIEGTYANFSFYRNDDYGTASIVNKTSSERYASVCVTGYSQKMGWIANRTNSSDIGYYGYLSISASQNESDHTFSSTPWYIDHSGSLYNSTQPIAGVLESFQVRTDPNANAWYP